MDRCTTSRLCFAHLWSRLITTSYPAIICRSSQTTWESKRTVGKANALVLCISDAGESINPQFWHTIARSGPGPSRMLHRREGCDLNALGFRCMLCQPPPCASAPPWATRAVPDSKRGVTVSREPGEGDAPGSRRSTH